jgi:hypothetical protein
LLHVIAIFIEMIQTIVKSALITSLMVLNLIICHAQQNDAKQSKVFGFELDALPYITGGYYGSVWIGYNKIRYRAVVAHINTPDFAVPDGFTNNELQAYAAIVDYFFQSGFKKWWMGSGIEYWKGKIQTEAQLSTATYYQTVFTFGGGYVWKFYKNFYLNPWAAVHVRVAGDTKVIVDGEEFTPSFLTPEASLKIGWHF